MKGIILAGGSGSRLYPATLAISKQLLPVFDKPMVYYPLSSLMLAGIREILIISTEQDIERFQWLFQDGKKLGLSLSYEVQTRPGGIAEAFLIGESFLQNEPSCLILGDNIFYGSHLKKLLSSCTSLNEGAMIFGYRVQDPSRYGVAAFDESPGWRRRNFAGNVLEDRCPRFAYCMDELARKDCQYFRESQTVCRSPFKHFYPVYDLQIYR